MSKRATKQQVGARSISRGIRAIVDADLPLEAQLSPKLRRAIIRERAEAVVAFTKQAIDEYEQRRRPLKRLRSTTKQRWYSVRIHSDSDMRSCFVQAASVTDAITANYTTLNSKLIGEVKRIEASVVLYARASEHK